MPQSVIFLDNNIYTYEFFLQEDVCRFCWNTEGDREILTRHSYKQDIVKNELADKIRDCLNLEINEDSYPRKACKSCCLKIEDFHNFKTLCRETDRKLQEIIKKYETKGFNAHVKEEKFEEPSGDLSNQVFDEFWDSLRDSDIEKYQYSDFENSGNEDTDLKRQKNTVKFNRCKPNGLPNEQTSCVDKHTLVVNNFVENENSLNNLQLLPSECLLQNDTDNIINKLENSTNTEKVSKTTKVKTKCPVKKKKYVLKRSATYCNICRLDLLSKEKLLMHNSQNHGIEDGGSIFKCFGCEKRFRSRKARLGHERNFCKGLKDGYKCKECERFLPKRSMYESHMRDHREHTSVELPEDIFQCAKCCKLFKTKHCLNEHMAAHESGKNSYVCETCGRVFTRQDYLHKHRLTHTGAKQHACPHCGYRTSQRSSLTVHIRKHTGERPYVCDVCPQRCISSSNLRAHRRRHLGDKDYQCNICTKKFGYKISLEEHIASVHERSQSFPCEQCGAMYTRIRGLRRHLLSKHGKQMKVDRSKKEDKSEPDTSLYLKMTTDDVNSKKSEVKESEEFTLKDGDFVILEANSSVMLSKIY